jgi:hypothetical protein
MNEVAYKLQSYGANMDVMFRTERTKVELTVVLRAVCAHHRPTHVVCLQLSQVL